MLFCIFLIIPNVRIISLIGNDFTSENRQRTDMSGLAQTVPLSAEKLLVSEGCRQTAQQRCCTRCSPQPLRNITCPWREPQCSSINTFRKKPHPALSIRGFLVYRQTALLLFLRVLMEPKKFKKRMLRTCWSEGSSDICQRKESACYRSPGNEGHHGSLAASPLSQP